MIASIFIQPHERREAIEAYCDRLSDEQIEQIEEAPDGALINMRYGIGELSVSIQIIEEG